MYTGLDFLLYMDTTKAWTEYDPTSVRNPLPSSEQNHIPLTLGPIQPPII